MASRLVPPSSRRLDPHSTAGYGMDTVLGRSRGRISPSWPWPWPALRASPLRPRAFLGRPGGVQAGAHEVLRRLRHRAGHRGVLRDRYKHIEEEAKRSGRGMWGLAVNIDPRSWRHRSRSRS